MDLPIKAIYKVFYLFFYSLTLELQAYAQNKVIKKVRDEIVSKYMYPIFDITIMLHMKAYQFLLILQYHCLLDVFCVYEFS